MAYSTKNKIFVLAWGLLMGPAAWAADPPHWVGKQYPWRGNFQVVCQEWWSETQQVGGSVAFYLNYQPGASLSLDLFYNVDSYSCVYNRIVGTAPKLKLLIGPDKKVRIKNCQNLGLQMVPPQFEELLAYQATDWTPVANCKDTDLMIGEELSTGGLRIDFQWRARAGTADKGSGHFTFEIKPDGELYTRTVSRINRTYKATYTAEAVLKPKPQ